MTTQISSDFIVKVRGTLGPRFDDLKSISMFNRVSRWVDGTPEKRECIQCDANPRDREVLLVQLGLSSVRGVVTPFEEVAVHDSTMAPLEGAVETFRSTVVRFGFVALDHLDAQYEAK